MTTSRAVEDRDPSVRSDDHEWAVASRHTSARSNVTGGVRPWGDVRNAAAAVTRVLLLVLLVTILIMIGLPWVLAAGASATR